MITLLALLTLKHLILDFFYQPPYQWANKGTYGHWGGVVHAGQHALATCIILFFFVTNPHILAALVLGEFLIHYHMDWFKMWYGKRMNYKPHPTMGCTVKQAEWFWFMLGIDQFVHAMTYIGIVALIYS
jgi:hypothetical protein